MSDAALNQLTTAIQIMDERFNKRMDRIDEHILTVFCLNSRVSGKKSVDYAKNSKNLQLS